MENGRSTNELSGSQKTYSFMAKYAQRAFGDDITNVSAQEETKRPSSGAKHVDDVFATPGPRSIDDPASTGKLLAKQLGEVAKSLGTPIERKTNAGRRCSILPDELELQTSILDLSGFDAQGERRRHSLSTPLIMNGKGQHSHAFTRSMPASYPATFAATSEVAELLSQRDEMMSILEGYQGTIAKMSDEYSRDACAWTSENKLLKTEVERLRRERQQIHEQFTVLYESKYVPLKEHAMSLERAVEGAAAASTGAQERAAEADALREELGAVQGKWEQSMVQVAEMQREIEDLRERLRHSSTLVKKINDLTSVNDGF